MRINPAGQRPDIVLRTIKELKVLLKRITENLSP
jgi:hypothetical protein